jgi:hypothetical protein
MSIILNLEDALPRFTRINAGGLRLLFDEAKSTFELVYGGFPCGDNLTGPSIHPNRQVYYTEFTKIH